MKKIILSSVVLSIFLVTGCGSQNIVSEEQASGETVGSSIQKKEDIVIDDKKIIQEKKATSVTSVQ